MLVFNMFQVGGDFAKLLTYEFGDRFPSEVDFCCATLSPRRLGGLVEAECGVAEAGLLST